MLTTTLLIGMGMGFILAAFMGMFRRPVSGPGQIVTVNPPPAAVRPPGCLAQIGAFVKLAAIAFLMLFFLRLLLLS